MTENLLRDETSPYLLQHRDNPVHWRPWGESAFEEARRTGRPVLLSLGYAACHWCHVMAPEWFANAAIARGLNQLFVSVQHDPKDRTADAATYQHAMASLCQTGGWPR